MLNIKKFNVRLSAVFVSMVVLFITVFSLSSSKADAGDFTLKYNVYNAATGQFLRDYNLTVEGNNARWEIRDDDREVDYSKNGVIKVITKELEEIEPGKFTVTYHTGTGFVVDDHTIATAAHLLKKENTIRVSSLLFFDQDGNVSMTIKDAVEYHYPDKYTPNGEKHHLYDYALITVKESLKDYRCFGFGMMTEDFPNSPSNVISVSGFPGEVRGIEVNTLSKHELYRGTGIVTSFDKGNSGNIEYIVYTAYASHGDSGGPVYVAEHINNKMYYTIIGIETHGSDYHNMAVAMSPHVLKFLRGNSNKEY